MIEWTDTARRHLDQLFDYFAIAADEAVAERVLWRIVNNVQQLSLFPMSGRVGRISGTRELPLINTPFIAVYSLEPGRIAILAIYHGAQRWPESL